MVLTKVCSNILAQLADLVNQIHEKDFVRPCQTLSNSTIGQHVRHTLEFFLCLQQGFERGIVNYDTRAHDEAIERDKVLTLAVISQVNVFVETLQEKPLQLEVGYDQTDGRFVTINTSAIRELVYNIEHAVHHMAIMKIGVAESAGYVKLVDGFGVAASTLRFKKVSKPIVSLT